MLTLMKQECTTKNGWSMREKFQNILAKKPLKLSKIVNLGNKKSCLNRYISRFSLNLRVCLLIYIFFLTLISFNFYHADFCRWALLDLNIKLGVYFANKVFFLEYASPTCFYSPDNGCVERT